MDRTRPSEEAKLEDMNRGGGKRGKKSFQAKTKSEQTELGLGMAVSAGAGDNRSALLTDAFGIAA